MKRFKNILFFADREEGLAPVLERAVNLSKTNDARLTVMDVTPDTTISSFIEHIYRVDINAQIREQRHQSLEELVAPYIESGIPVYTKTLTGIAFIELIRAVKRSNYDLVIKAAHSDTGKAPTVLGSTDMHLLRKCPCPIWIERLHKEHAYRGILAAVNPQDDKTGDLSKLIMDLAVSLADSEHARLDIVHAWELPGESILANGRGRIPRRELDLMLDSTEKQHKHALDVLLSSYGLDSEADNVHLVKGGSAKTISRYTAELKSDLVVMGTIGRVGIPGLIIGNTAEDVLRETQISVLAVKPLGFESPVQ